MMHDFINLKADEKFLRQLNSYKKIDGLLAVLLFVFYYYFLFNYFKILTYDYPRELVLIEQSIPTIGLSIIMLSLLLFSRQQLPSTIGLSKQNIFKSLFFGFIMLIGFFFILLFYDYIFNGNIEIIILYPFLTYFVYDFIQFGMIEELIFRGYIGTRIRSIIKNRWVSMIVVAILFSSIHLIPYISPLEMSIWDAIKVNWFQLTYTFIFHFIAQLTYEKYNNIAGPILMHGVGNIIAKWIIF